MLQQSSNQKPQPNSGILTSVLKAGATELLGEQISNNVIDIKKFIPEVVIKYYENIKELERLKFQLSKVNIFLNDQSVQVQVQYDFDHGNFSLFDPSNGDNNCESRVYLMEIFSKLEKGSKYKDLAPDEKLLLTMCHVLRLKQLDTRDALFGLMIDEKKGEGNIKYSNANGTTMTSANNYNGFPSRYNGNNLLTASDLIGHAMSNISVKFLQNVAERVSDNNLLLDLTSYNRLSGKNKIPLPTQVTEASAITAMYKYLSLSSLPLLYKITRLEVTSEGKFKLQGASLVLKAPDKGELKFTTAEDFQKLDKNKPIPVFEMFSMYKPNSEMLSELKAMNDASNMEAFVDAFKAAKTEELIQKVSIYGDVMHANGKLVTFKSSGLTAFSSENIMQVGSIMLQRYATKYSSIYRRNAVAVPFSPCHVFISTVSQEEEKIKTLSTTAVGDTIDSSEIMMKMNNQNIKEYFAYAKEQEQRTR